MTSVHAAIRTWHALEAHRIRHVLTKAHHVLQIETSRRTIRELMICWKWEVTIAVGIGPARSDVRWIQHIGVHETELENC